MKLPYRLRAPGGKRKTYSFRCRIKGVGELEISTGETEEAAAWEVAANLWEMTRDDPVLQGKATVYASETVPEVVPLGPFEHYLMSNFTLVGEDVFQLGTGKAVVFYASGHGYREAAIPWAMRKKKVLEHRMKFLLHHRWLPRSIDHINRVRNDNALANLEASTPLRQSANRGKTGGRKQGNVVQLVVSN
jgi:hypothetical protein